MQNSGLEHWTAVKHNFWYLNGTKNLGITYGGKDDIGLSIVAYSDADWASNPNDQKSISGNVFFLGRAAIGWLSKKQNVTANSMCDAKYVSAAT